MKSVEERLIDAQQALALVIASVKADPNHVGLTREELADAIASAAGRAHNDLYWLQLALNRRKC